MKSSKEKVEMKSWAHDVLLASLKKMKNLKRLKIVGSFFKDIYQEHDFIEALVRYGIHIDSFAYECRRPVVGMIEPGEIIAADLLPIREFSWDMGAVKPDASLDIRTYFLHLY